MKKQFNFGLSGIAFFFLVLAEVASAGVVTNAADSGPGSLRQVIASAASGDTITFATNLSGGTIVLTSGQVTLTNVLTIDASALPAGIQITSSGSRIFNLTNTAAVTLTALTITGGMDSTRLGGGGIYNGGFLSVNQCTVSGNSAPNALANCGGGGIFNSNVLIVTQSTITGNLSDGDTAANSGGGGIYNIGNGMLMVNQSTITGNHADSDTYGGGGIFNLGVNVTIFNSIVAGNATTGSGADIYTVPSINLSGVNIIQSIHGNTSGTTPIFAAPLLAVLGNYGGTTPTMPPLINSPAINSGCFNTDDFTNDQRGVPRVAGGLSDIGSVELAPPTVVTGDATAPVSTNANINATVNPNGLATTAWFQWGLTNNPYPNQTTPVVMGSGTNAVAFTNTFTGLTPGLLYYCQAVASNVDGLSDGGGILFGSSPIVTLIGAADITNECHTAFTDPGATNAAGLPVMVTGRVNTNSPNIYQLIYTATNSLGLSGSVMRLVTVADTTPPVITLLGTNPIIILTNTPYMDPGATALDACGGSFAVTSNNPVNPAVAANYTITYTSTDSYGNTGTATRTVVVRNHSVLVTTTNDSGPGSLRDTIVKAFVGDDIQFATNLSGATILLTNGLLNITNNLAIDASALPNSIHINADAKGPAFFVATNTTLELTGLTITNGSPTGELPGGGICAAGGTLTLNQCILAGNVANGSFGGGGIANLWGTLTLNQCALTGNTANNTLGVSYVMGGTTETGSGGGGGILNYGGTMTVNQCTFFGNSANSNSIGGGIFNFEGTLTVNQCTYNGNSSNTNGGGGGIASITDLAGALNVNQSTITGNHADFGTNNGGGGIATIGESSISNCIVAGNTSTNGTGTDLFGDGALSGENIVEGLAGSFNGNTPINASPKLAPLGNYGGPTQTMPPLVGSPAVDACDDSSFTTDQRGFPRLIGAFPDIGAVEGVYNSNGPGRLTGVTRLANGATRFGFTNLTDVSFTVLASTNVNLPMSIWTNLGPVLESPIGSGQFQFTDSQATNFPQRFYRVRSP